MSKKLTFAISILAAATLIVSGTVVMGKIKPRSKPAGSQAPVEKKITMTTTGAHNVGASGHSGKQHRVGADKDYPLAWLGWSERSDKPCYMWVMGTTYKNGEAKAYEQELKICSKKSSSYRRMNFTSPNEDFYRVISGVQVCTSEKKSSDDERLKGIRIFSSLIDMKTGEVQKEGETEDDHRTNCKTWHDEVHCPDGEVATALLVQEGTGGKANDAFQGIGLECSKVVFK